MSGGKEIGRYQHEGTFEQTKDQFFQAQRSYVGTALDKGERQREKDVDEWSEEMFGFDFVQEQRRMMNKHGGVTGRLRSIDLGAIAQYNGLHVNDVKGGDWGKAWKKTRLLLGYQGGEDGLPKIDMEKLSDDQKEWLRRPLVRQFISGLNFSKRDVLRVGDLDDDSRKFFIGHRSDRERNLRKVEAPWIKNTEALKKVDENYGQWKVGGASPLRSTRRVARHKFKSI